jgi:hypothetical protein
MNVNKLVVVNPVEPSPLSFRAPLGVSTRLDVTYLTPAGNAISSDLAAQLQLTGRSSARTISYFMPATDIANGRARTNIPGGDLTDINGYRLVLVGTVNSEPAVLATGSVMPIASAGFEPIPADLIDTIDLVLTRGRVAQVGVKLWDDVGGSDPFDLADEGTSVTSSIYASYGGEMLVPFTVTVVASNEVLLTLEIAQVDALPDLCWWSLVASNASGANTLCEGKVTVMDAP